MTLTPGPASHTASHALWQVTHAMAEAVRTLDQLGSLLLNGATSAGGPQDPGQAAHQGHHRGAEEQLQLQGAHHRVRRAAEDVEKDQLRDEVRCGGFWEVAT